MRLNYVLSSALILTAVLTGASKGWAANSIGPIPASQTFTIYAGGPCLNPFSGTSLCLETNGNLVLTTGSKVTFSSSSMPSSNIPGVDSTVHANKCTAYTSAKKSTCEAIWKNGTFAIYNNGVAYWSTHTAGSSMYLEFGSGTLVVLEESIGFVFSGDSSVIPLGSELVGGECNSTTYLTHYYQGPNQTYNYQVCMENNGQLEITRNGTTLWKTPTVVPGCNKNCVVKFQTDGNLVLYKGSQSYWTSGTHGKSGVSFSFIPTECYDSHYNIYISYLLLNTFVGTDTSGQQGIANLNLAGITVPEAVCASTN